MHCQFLQALFVLTIIVNVDPESNILSEMGVQIFFFRSVHGNSCF